MQSCVGFHIWPKGVSESNAKSIEETGTVDAIGEHNEAGVPTRR